ASNRTDYFEMANSMRRAKGYDVLARLAIRTIKKEEHSCFVIEGLRTREEIGLLRRIFKDIVLVGVCTSLEERLRRVEARRRQIDPMEIQMILKDIDREASDVEEGCQLAAVMEICDIYISGELSLPDTEARILEVITSVP